MYSIKQIVTTNPFELKNSNLVYCQYGCVDLRIKVFISKTSYPTDDSHLC